MLFNRQPQIFVISRKHDEDLANHPSKVSVHRGTVLGNPYSSKSSIYDVIQTESPKESVEMFKEWLDDKIKSSDQTVLSELKKCHTILNQTGKLYLECFCRSEVKGRGPLLCHANYIKTVLQDSKVIQLLKAVQN